MAYNNDQSPAFVVIALILFAAANPLCHAQLGLGDILGIFPDIVNGITPLVTPLKTATSVVPGVLNSITPVVPGVLNSITPVVPGVLNSITPVVPGVLNSLTPILPGVVNSVTPAVPGVVNSVTPAAPAVVNSLTPPVVNCLTPPPPAVVNSPPPPPPPAGLNGLNISGRLCCNENGNCPVGETPLPAGIPITVNCTNMVGGTVTVGQGAIVGTNGGFNVSVINLMSTLGGFLNPNMPIPCIVFVPLPLNETVCPTLSTVTGNLIGAASTVQNITSTPAGLIGSVRVRSFSAEFTV